MQQLPRLSASELSALPLAAREEYLAVQAAYSGERLVDSRGGGGGGKHAGGEVGACGHRPRGLDYRRERY
eukprot:SAG11_NODE_17396_length_520_cov_0.703088_1_plen_70_part_00